RVVDTDDEARFMDEAVEVRGRHQRALTAFLPVTATADPRLLLKRSKTDRRTPQRPSDTRMISNSRRLAKFFKVAVDTPSACAHIGSGMTGSTPMASSFLTICCDIIRAPPSGRLRIVALAVTSIRAMVHAASKACLRCLVCRALS